MGSISLLERQHLALLRLALSEDCKVDDCLVEQPIDWEKLWRSAEEQCTLGLLSDAMNRLPKNLWPARQERLMWSAVAKQLEERNDAVNAAIETLVQLFEKEDVTYVMVKGQTVASLYPHPELRQSGDVDFYVPENDFYRAKQLISQKLKVEVSGAESNDKHDSFEYEGVRFEMHYRLETFGTTSHQRIFDSLIDKCLIEEPCYRNVNNTPVRILPPVEEIVHAFKHLFNHLLMEGVGLRQFCDMYQLLRSFDMAQKQPLEQTLHDIGYYRAFLAIGAMLEKHFGYPASQFPFTLSAFDRKWADSLLKVALDRGNFGKYNRLKKTDPLIHKMDTARIAFGHCVHFFYLAPRDIMGLVPRRTGIALRNRLHF